MGFSYFDFGLQSANMTALWQVFCAVLPVWIFGAITGYLLPRPSKVEPTNPWVLFFTGAHFRKFAISYHLAVIVRDVWNTYTSRGTFRAVAKAVWRWCCGKGFYFEFPAVEAESIAELAGSSVSLRDSDNWYVTQKDLAFFQYHADGGECPGASAWELMMEKDVPNVVKYTAWRRTLASGKTEYKSITYSPDATPEEFLDLYLDDDFRPRWDTMIIHHEVLEHGDFAERQQVVRWIRRFPFKFLSDREYTLARRMFKDDSGTYGITKAVDHPRFRQDSQVVKMDVFYSMWRSRAVDCPWNSGKPACETVLLHHENFKIPEKLARFAVRHGMWGFVKTMADQVPQFVAQRRAHCASNQVDAQAYGCGAVPNPPMQRTGTSQSSLSLSSLNSSYSDFSRQSSQGLNSSGRSMTRRAKGMVAVAVASGLALLINRGNRKSITGSVKALSKRRQHREWQTAEPQ